MTEPKRGEPSTGILGLIITIVLASYAVGIVIGMAVERGLCK